jgi:hypothetical protein
MKIRLIVLGLFHACEQILMGVLQGYDHALSSGTGDRSVIGSSQIFKEKYSIKMNIYLAKFQVLFAAIMMMAVVWDVAPSSLLEIDRHFRGAYCLHHPYNGSSKNL